MCAISLLHKNTERMDKLIPDAWHDLLKDVVATMEPDFPKFVNEMTIPAAKDLFTAFKWTAPDNVSVVIFGQDPYPRRESAGGVSFCDFMINSWNSPLPPSLRNIIKSVLISQNLATKSSKIDDLRKVLKNREEPKNWFKRLATKNGVLWLNSSLTFLSKDPQNLKEHADFWAPFLAKIIEILKEKRVVFVLWGSVAANLKDFCEGKNSKIVMNSHPMMEKFHGKCTFEEILEAQKELGVEIVDFLPRKIEQEKFGIFKQRRI